MIERSIFYRLWSWLLTKIGLTKKYEVDKLDMCRMAVQSGVCPKVCDRCAWGERKKQ